MNTPFNCRFNIQVIMIAAVSPSNSVVAQVPVSLSTIVQFDLLLL